MCIIRDDKAILPFVVLALLGARGIVVQPRNVVRAVLVHGRDLDVIPCIAFMDFPCDP